MIINCLIENLCNLAPYYYSMRNKKSTDDKCQCFQFNSPLIEDRVITI